MSAGPPAVSVALCAVFLFCSCSLFGPAADIVVRLPPVPAGLEGVYGGFSLIYPDGSGRIVTESGVPAGTGVFISIPKGMPVPVIAVPEGPGFLPPAGGVWLAEGAAALPAEGSAGWTAESPVGWTAGGAAGTLPLSWETGAAAEIILRLFRAGFPVGAVNVERLLAEIGDRSEGDPWRIDIGAVCEAFWYDSMRADKIKPSDGHSLTLPAAPGTWISGNPLAPARALEAADGSLTIRIWKGCSSFYRAGTGGGGTAGETTDGVEAASGVEAAGGAAGGSGGAVERLDICCDETGWFAVNPVTGYGGSGTW